MHEKSDGLRQRKRHETRKRLESAAIDLVVRGGLEHATIEAISEKANVSPRTFFNYFDSKEDALLGLHNIEISEDTVNTCADRYQSSNLAAAITNLLVGLIGPSLTDPELYKTRRQLIKKHPQLLERQMSRIAQMSRRLTATVQRIAKLRGNTAVNESEAEILLALCSSSVRIAIREWLSTGRKISLPKLEQQAIQKLNEVLKKI